MTTYFIVGMKHREAERFVAELPRGEPLALVREPLNKYDRFAVQVWARGRHVAYVRATQAMALAKRMDTNAPLATDSALPRERSLVGALAFSATHRVPMVEIEE